MTLRAVTASFNAIAMIAYAVAATGGPGADRHTDVRIWGSAAAAVAAALTVLLGLPPALAWVAIGYVLSAATLGGSVLVILVLLAVAFMPLVPRPRGSLALGLLVAGVSLVAFRIALARAV